MGIPLQGKMIKHPSDMCEGEYGIILIWGSHDQYIHIIVKMVEGDLVDLVDGGSWYNIVYHRKYLYPEENFQVEILNKDEAERRLVQWILENS